MILFRSVLALTVAVGLAACGGRTSGLMNDTGAAEKKGDADALVTAGDELWNSRGDRAAAEGAIAKWTEASVVDPTRADIPLKLSRAYYFLAIAHVRWEKDPDDKLKALYLKGVEAGERAIKLESPAFAAKIKGGAKWPEAVKSVELSGIAGLYWYATNLGRWGLLEGITAILAHKDDIFAIMEHVRALDETFFHGAPHRYFGVYWAKLPFGKDLNKSKTHFEKAMGISGNYLETKVLFAEYYAAYSDDEALFKKVLNEVLTVADDVDPTITPENINAKRTAKYMLANVADFF